MSKGKIIILSGPSGSGKTTLHKRLLCARRLKGKLVKSVSVTTRPRRRNERHGRDYLFISQKEYFVQKKKGRFLESEKVFDHDYATPKKGVRDLLAKKKNVLLCIDVKGAKTVSRCFPDAVKIFITAPSMKELAKRLNKRKSETKKTLALRLKVARKEMKEARHYDYVVVNAHLPSALKRLETIVEREIKK
ncbi:MAG: guanylate kinase [Candidatus Omnitrophota bacterium]